MSKQLEEIDGGGVVHSTPTPTPLPPAPKINPYCTKTQTAADGAGGFLWKPVSDSDGKVAVILPARFVKKFDEVAIVTPTGGVEQLRFTTFANGDRQHWRGSKPGGKYPSGSRVSAKDFLADDVNECVWVIKKTSERVD